MRLCERKLGAGRNLFVAAVRERLKLLDAVGAINGQQVGAAKIMCERAIRIAVFRFDLLKLCGGGLRTVFLSRKGRPRRAGLRRRRDGRFGDLDGATKRALRLFGVLAAPPTEDGDQNGEYDETANRVEDRQSFAFEAVAEPVEDAHRAVAEGVVFEFARAF